MQLPAHTDVRIVPGARAAIRAAIRLAGGREVCFVGTVEAIGLRSTRFRTLDRTIISIPNGKLDVAETIVAMPMVEHNPAANAIVRGSGGRIDACATLVRVDSGCECECAIGRAAARNRN